MYLHLQFKSNIGKYMYGKYTIHGFYASVPNPRFSGEPWRRPAVPHGLVLWGSCCVSQDLGSKGAAFLGLPKLCRDRLGQWWLWMVLAVSFQSLTVWCLCRGDVSKRPRRPRVHCTKNPVTWVPQVVPEFNGLKLKKQRPLWNLVESEGEYLTVKEFTQETH